MCFRRTVPVPYRVRYRSVPADRDGKVEEGEHLAAHVLDKHVGDDGGGDGGVGRLADAHHGATRHKCPEVGVAPLSTLQKYKKISLETNQAGS